MLALCVGSVFQYIPVIMFLFVSLSSQVLVVCLITGILSYPNIYTRANASEVIKQLFSQCGPEDNSKLWYVVKLVCKALYSISVISIIIHVYFHHSKFSTCM